MAEVEKARDQLTPAGKEPTVYEGLSASDTYLIANASGHTILRIENGGAEATEVTIVTPVQTGGLAVEDQKVTVANGKTKFIGPFDPAVFNNANGFLEVKLSKVTSVKMNCLAI